MRMYMRCPEDNYEFLGIVLAMQTKTTTTHMIGTVRVSGRSFEHTACMRVRTLELDCICPLSYRNAWHMHVRHGAECLRMPCHVLCRNLTLIFFKLANMHTTSW